ncbi:invasion associated locus B family protein [Vannielia litorea]|uniref:Invasion protein IalB, involved in pathogenesis n=1 Tax=Vannielia litorea TaxID=1217970 RepID=A0A1N6F494_9RHOB|nr:invasion associated locus B family protein [Vannielia litorea]SIN90024.1 Invasion protein IalB, involved in pathogenesis [Vannielia litorea]
MTHLAPFALALALCLPCATATAQEATETAPEASGEVSNNTAFGDWIVSCEAVTTRKTACSLVQEQRLKEGGQLVARFVALPVSDGAILLAQVPMGVYLPGGAVYRFAGNEALEQREMIWQRCAENVCEAAAPLNEEELAVFAEEEALLFGFRPAAEGEPVILRVDISRFAEAVEQLRDSAG